MAAPERPPPGRRRIGSEMRILVPVDGSAPANRAVAHAIGLARGRDDALIVVVNVQGPETIEVSDVSAVMSVAADRRLAARRSTSALRKAARLCTTAEVRFETRAELGPIAETIDRLARELQVDQIVIGSRGLGGIGRLILGSVATKVARLARVPVTLVK
jgi:nucleotide-binding universal stress UspA family protein